MVKKEGELFHGYNSAADWEKYHALSEKEGDQPGRAFQEIRSLQVHAVSD
jgi:hypothetical protein